MKPHLASIIARHPRPFLRSLTGHQPPPRVKVAFVFSINPDRTKVRWVGGFRNRTDDGDVQPFTFYWVNGDPFDIEDYYVGCTPDVDCFWEGGPAGQLT